MRNGVQIKDLSEIEKLRSRRMVIFFYTKSENVPLRWPISDWDGFLENLESWNTDNLPTLAAFFSSPTSGIKQHLANTKDRQVIVAGERLEQWSSEMTREYHRRHYDVIHYRNGRIKYEPHPNTNNVTIQWS